MKIFIWLFVQVWAGTPVNSVVISMFAKDLDAGENGTVKFSMKGKPMRRWQVIFNSWLIYVYIPLNEGKLYLWFNLCLVFCHILLDNQLGHFSIDSHNGDVKVTSRFSSNTQMRYTLRVVAMDNGLFPLEETAVVDIQVSEAGSGI